MDDKKLYKPENMADEKTYRVIGIIEPPFMADAVGGFCLDGVPIKNGYNFDNVSVSNIDTDKMRNLVNPEAGEESNSPPDSDSDSYVQEYSDYFIFTNKKTGKETKVDKK